MLTVEQLIQDCDDLPTFPDVYLRVKEVVEDPKASMVELARALSVDPAMTARVLRLVNSPFYGLSGKIETVSRAASILGMQPIHDLVLATSLASTFSKIQPDVMDMKTFWQQCVERGLLARVLGQHCQLIDSERLFVGGLLCDIGHLVLYQKMPDLASQVFEQAKTEMSIRPKLELKTIGFEAAEVGARVLAHWHLPENYQRSTRYHMNPFDATEHSLELDILHLAGVVVECQLLDIPRENWRQWLTIHGQELQDLSEEDLNRMLELVQEGLSQTLEIFAPAMEHAA
ncbi:HDOD domain-containing protein [Nitrospira sp. M1]